MSLVDTGVLILDHFRLFGTRRGGAMLLNHIPWCRERYETHRFRDAEERRGLITEFGLDGNRLWDEVGRGVSPLRIHDDLSLLIRPGTQDAKTFRQVLGGQPYRIRVPWEPRTIIDGGANVGFASISFARQFPKADIIAVEPEEGNFRVMCDNLRPFSLVKTIQAAIWPRKESLQITNPGAASWSFQVGPIKEGADMSVLRSVTMNELSEQAADRLLDIVKLDIEGAEKALFADGDNEWLTRTGAILIEFHDRRVPGCRDSFFAALSKGDWRLFYWGETVIAVNQRFSRV